MARIVVVTPNPAIDVTYTVAAQSIGETHRVETVEQRPGGKGVNVARVLALLGHEPVALLPLGGAAGSWMSDAIARLGLDLIAFPIAGETRTTVAVVDPEHHPTLFAEAGPELSPDEVAALRERIRAACVDAELLVVSGSLPPGVSADEVGGWVAAAHSEGALALVDAGGRALRAAAVAGADILKPNEAELLEATGAADVASGIAALVELGANTVVVSRGANGLVAVDPTGARFEVAAIPRVDGNPTGAGDAATAGVASAFLDGLAMPDLLRRAAALGAAAVLRPVAGEIDLDAYRRFVSTDHGASQ
ncbi:MAG TPA: hexose kinase [Galbitalea sp.]|jgi:1-phosphofructokinase family hexose kinase